MTELRNKKNEASINFLVVLKSALWRQVSLIPSNHRWGGERATGHSLSESVGDRSKLECAAKTMCSSVKSGSGQGLRNQRLEFSLCTVRLRTDSGLRVTSEARNSLDANNRSSLYDALVKNAALNCSSKIGCSGAPHLSMNNA